MKKRDFTIYVAKTKALISFAVIAKLICVFVFACTKIWFSYEAAEPGTIARSVVMSLGNQEAPRSILASGTSFREDLVMKILLLPFFLFR